jgi:Fe-S-cluster containining protein
LETAIPSDGVKRENEKWIPRGYGLDAPELDVYDCINLDKEGRRCKAYDQWREPFKSTLEKK